MALFSLAACGRGQEPPTAPPASAPLEQPHADETARDGALLGMVPADARHLAHVRVAEAMAQPLFQSLVTELRQIPRLAERAEQIEQQCGADPLQAVGEILVFDAQSERQAIGQGSARSSEMLVQLRRPAGWALDCLSSLRDDVARTEVNGRPARQLGSFVAIDAGDNRLLIAHHEAAPAALQRLQEPGPAAHQAAERAERLGSPLLFGTGAFENQMGVRSAETVVTAEGEALEFLVTGNMRDAQAAENAVRQLQLGMTLAGAVIDRQVQGGPQSGAQPDETRQRLRSLLDNVRIESAEDRVRVGLRLPDAATQRFVGEVLARFIGEGGMHQRQQPEGPEPDEGQGGLQQPTGNLPGAGKQR